MDVTGSLHSFSFPLLKNADIVACLAEAGIDLTEHELMEPQRFKDRVKMTFSALVHLGLGYDEEYFHELGETLSSQVMEGTHQNDHALSHKELHADAQALTELKFYQSCKNFMRICGIPTDFGMSDLSAPTSKRFRKQLSAAINFIKFREEKLELYAELQEQRDELLNGLAEVQEEQVSLQEALQQAREQAGERWEQAEGLEKEASELETEISTQNKLQASIRHESTQLKRQAKELKDKIDTATLEVAELEAAERKLLPQIVHSPKEIQSKVLSLKHTLAEEQKSCDESKKSAQSLSAKIVQVDQGIHIINKILEELNQVSEEQEKLRKVQQECQEVQDMIDKSEAEVAKIKEECCAQERELQRIGKCTDPEVIWK